MAYAVENALYQWQDGERWVRDADDPHVDRAVEAVVDELRRRLGSTFVLSELADFYASGTDWADQLAARHAGTSSASSVVDAAFARYAREASNFAGGRTREEHEKPD